MAAVADPGPLPDERADADLVLRVFGEVVGDLEGLPPARLTLDTDLADMGLDSLAVIELHDRLEEACGVPIPEDVMRTGTTPGDWVRAVRRARAPSAAPSRARPAERPPGSACPPSVDTLVGALAWQAERHPELACIRIVGSDDAGPDDVSYADLLERSTAVARGIVAEGLTPGERVAILLPSGRAYFEAFTGALLAGCVPVPLYPPATPGSFVEHLEHERPRLRSAGVGLVVADAEVPAPARTAAPTRAPVRTVPELAAAAPSSSRLPLVRGGDTALIQYTSGSTSDPKGVVLSHDQVLANVRALGRAVDVRDDDAFVSWLPLYHDMGLIGAWHGSLLFGMPLVLLDPLQFLKRPARWFETIDAYRGTISAGPSSAYQLCVDRVTDEEMAGVDLSGWRLAINGSEPVSAATIARFLDRFGRFGFSPTAMCPAYGLAELGVGLAIEPPGTGVRIDRVERQVLQTTGRAVPSDEPDAWEVVGCGPAVPGYELRIVDEHARELGPRREGRVQCRGPSATTGYFGDLQATEELWEDGWLETGDLGYVADGDLFLTGRAKDVIIRHGRNLHPEDLETALADLEGSRLEGVAVFAVDGPLRAGERLVVVVELDPGAEADESRVRSSIRRTAARVFGSGPDEILLVPEGTIPRTANLKVRRAATRALFEQGLLPGAGAAGHRRGARPVAEAAAREGAPARAARAAEWAFSAYVWALVAVLGTLLWLGLQLPLSRRARWSMARWATRAVALASGIEVRTSGALSPEAAVVVANHVSMADALAIILAAPGPLVFSTSAEMGRHPVVGGVLRRLGCVFLHRGEVERSAGDVEEMAQAVRDGARLVVFPEGGVGATGELRPFHLGAFAVARAAGCPVVPVGIRGTRGLLPPRSYRVHRRPVDVAFGTPVAPSSVVEQREFAAEVALRDLARRQVAALVDLS